MRLEEILDKEGIMPKEIKAAKKKPKKGEAKSKPSREAPAPSVQAEETSAPVEAVETEEGQAAPVEAVEVEVDVEEPTAGTVRPPPGYTGFLTAVPGTTDRIVAYMPNLQKPRNRMSEDPAATSRKLLKRAAPPARRPSPKRKAGGEKFSQPTAEASVEEYIPLGVPVESVEPGAPRPKQRAKGQRGFSRPTPERDEADLRRS